MPMCTEFCFNFLSLLRHIKFKQFKSEGPGNCVPERDLFQEGLSYGVEIENLSCSPHGSDVELVP